MSEANYRESIKTAQFKALLWKNFTFKIRRPKILIFQVLIPLILLGFLIAMRFLVKLENNSQCFLHEQFLPSMGVFPFFQSYLCTNNYTCHTTSQLPDDNDKLATTSIQISSYFRDINTMLVKFNAKTPPQQSHISTLLKNYGVTNNAALLNSKFLNEQPVYEFINAINTYSTDSDSKIIANPIITSLKFFSNHFYIIEQLFSNKTVLNNTQRNNAIISGSNLFCGNTQNDLKRLLINNINRIQPTQFSDPKKSPTTQSPTMIALLKCQSLYLKYFGPSIFYSIQNFLIGKIYYTPNNAQTQKIMNEMRSFFETTGNFIKISNYFEASVIPWLKSITDTNSPELAFMIKVFERCAKISFNTEDENDLKKFCSSTANWLTIQKASSPKDWITSFQSFLVHINSFLKCFATKLKIIPIESEDEIKVIEKNLTTGFFAGIVFDKLINLQNSTQFLNVRIRMPIANAQSTRDFVVKSRQWTPGVNRRHKYYSDGFLFLQDLIERGYIKSLITSNQKSNINIGSSLEMFPNQCYTKDNYITFVSGLLTFFVIIIWSNSFSNLTKSIVDEKEKRLKEFMKVMGLSTTIYWFTWWLVSFIIFLLIGIIISVVLVYGKILVYSNFVIILLLEICYCFSIISQAFLISTLFTKASIASTAASIIYICLYMPTIVLEQFADNITVDGLFGLSLISQVAKAIAINYVMIWEKRGIGIQFDNINDPVGVDQQYKFSYCLVMLVVDGMLYGLIGLYIDAVVPGTYGIGKPWYFLFTKRFWCGSDDVQNKDLVLTQEAVNNASSANLKYPENFEADPTHLKVGVRIENLTKIYSGSNTPAVNNLSINFYENQITSFLGHNGAGKSTTISVLTGMYAPSSGTAFINGADICKDIVKIRQRIGFCPQYNTLFDNLNVQDHIKFYALIRNMKQSMIGEITNRVLNEVGLLNKKNVMVSNLSGGMKRKLSVALAFLGNDISVIFLDEPTAGIDPYARRGIWDLIKSYQKGRSIVLTTHHMDEADVLGDRIAIITDGQLKCCGTNVFLKNRFSDGYKLTIVKGQDSQQADTDFINEIVTQKFSDAKLVFNGNYEWKFLLPQSGLNDGSYSEMLKLLETNEVKTRATSYGISDTTLEEVFIKATDCEIEPEKSGENGNVNLNQITKSDNNITKTTKHHGIALFAWHITALFIKRFHRSKRSIADLFVEIVLPLVMIIVIVYLLQRKPEDEKIEIQPKMQISPWLMQEVGKRDYNLRTFYQSIQNTQINVTETKKKYAKSLEAILRNDAGQSGVKCLNQDKIKYSLDRYPCAEKSNTVWQNTSTRIDQLNTRKCDCQASRIVCERIYENDQPPQYRKMQSGDLLKSLASYNLTDYLLNSIEENIDRRYGGHQFLLNIPAYQSWMVLSAHTKQWNRFVTLITQQNMQSAERTAMTDSIKNLVVAHDYVRIWYNNKGFVSATSYLNIWNNLLLRHQLDSVPIDQSGITLATHPLDKEYVNKYSDVVSLLLNDTLTGFLLNFALSFVAASYIMWLISERATNAKQLQFIAGIQSFTYWLANFLWDFIKFLLPIFFTVLMLLAFENESLINTRNTQPLIELLILYACSLICLNYPLSFLFKVPSTGFIVLIAINFFAGYATLLVTFILDLIGERDEAVKNANTKIKWVFLVFPQFCMGRGLYELSYNYLQTKTNANEVLEPRNADVMGRHLIALAIHTLFWFTLAVLLDCNCYRQIKRACRRCTPSNSFASSNQVSNLELYDEDVKAEMNKVKDSLQVYRSNQGDAADSSSSNQMLLVNELTKVYESCCCCTKNCKSAPPKLKAVDSVSFLVRRGECFGLLGVNGAGKTTTFKMLTGELEATDGEVLISDYLVQGGIGSGGAGCCVTSSSVGSIVGYCPQFDALHDTLTCREELALYARLRGIPQSQIAENVNKMIATLSLTKYEDKLIYRLSGGNKRKLSTALAMIGDSKMIFLDEPTAGMDAGARRFLWSTINNLITSGVSVLLTSHSMEECEVLCNRLTIMVNGKFCCLGTVQHLKNRFGKGYTILVRHENQNETTTVSLSTELGEDASEPCILRTNSVEENSAAITFAVNNSEKSSCVNQIKANFRNLIDTGMISVKERNSNSIKFMAENAINLPEIFNILQSMKQSGVCLDYSVVQTTLDEIFIRFAKSNASPSQMEV